MSLDCHTIATLLVRRRKPEEALVWVERGIDLDRKATHGSMAGHDLAARLWRAQGLRIVNARKSRYYDAALSNFESAKRCYERAGLHGKWQKTVSQVRADHHRKSGFMDGFERLVQGVGPSDEPSFMEQAKARFHERHRRAR